MDKQKDSGMKIKEDWEILQFDPNKIIARQRELGKELIEKQALYEELTDLKKSMKDEQASVFLNGGKGLGESEMRANASNEFKSLHTFPLVNGRHLSQILGYNATSMLTAIENNIKDLRPKYPFIRSILLKLEKCLFLERNILAGLINKETNTFKKVKNNYIVRKFDSLNSWQGGVLYFLFLILMLFLINRYFISNISIIEIQIIEEKVNEK